MTDGNRYAMFQRNLLEAAKLGFYLATLFIIVEKDVARQRRQTRRRARRWQPASEPRYASRGTSGRGPFSVSMTSRIPAASAVKRLPMWLLMPT